jgi:pre-mRNA-processing factor 19
VDFSGKNLFS